MNFYIVVCLKEDYGRVGAIDGAKLHECVKTTTPGEFLKTEWGGEDDSPSSMLVNFLLRYPTHSFQSKGEVRRVMMETRVNKVTDENGQESTVHACFLDMMSKSDVAFCLWRSTCTVRVTGHTRSLTGTRQKSAIIAVKRSGHLTSLGMES
jgi:hypothetical protein